jgi:hypothetical protein
MVRENIPHHFLKRQMTWGYNETRGDQPMKRIFFPTLIGLTLLTGCSFPGAATPTPTQAVPAPILFVTTDTPHAPTPTPLPLFTPTATPIPPVAQNVCTDPQVVALIDSLKRSMLNGDGPLLSSLVSPKGMEVRYFRDSTPITYTPYQATFLFETTYLADWGADPGSGQQKKGAFHDVIVPELKKIFAQTYTLHCNEIRHGGATYNINWPYTRDFYSIHFAGTEQNGYLDWHTWVVGVEYTNSKPTIYALMNFFWEP